MTTPNQTAILMPTRCAQLHSGGLLRALSFPLLLLVLLLIKTWPQTEVMQCGTVHSFKHLLFFWRNQWKQSTIQSDHDSLSKHTHTMYSPSSGVILMRFVQIDQHTKWGKSVLSYAAPPSEIQGENMPVGITEIILTRLQLKLQSSVNQKALHPSCTIHHQHIFRKGFAFAHFHMQTKDLSAALS